MNNWADEVDEKGFVIATIVAAIILVLGFFTPSPFAEFVVGAIVVWLVIAIGYSPILIAVALDSTLGRGIRHCLYKVRNGNGIGVVFYALLLICQCVILAVVVFYIVLIALLGIFFGGLAVLSIVRDMMRSIFNVDI